MTGLADVDRFKICIQVCVWLGFQPLLLSKPWLSGLSFFKRYACLQVMQVQEICQSIIINVDGSEEQYGRFGEQFVRWNSLPSIEFFPKLNGNSVNSMNSGNWINE